MCKLTDAEWFEMNCNPPAQLVGGAAAIRVPLLPSDQVQLRFTGRMSRLNLEQAFEFYRFVLRQAPKPESVFDFGGGWGRILRFFLREVKPAQLYLIDCLTDAVMEARRTKATFNIIQTKPGQPCPLPDGTIDVVNAFSVFSHLSETVAVQALRDFSRVLTAGGQAIITTRGRWYFQHLRQCQAQNPAELSPHAAAVLKLVPNWEELERGIQRGGYEFFATGGGSELTNDFYGEAWIGENWIKERFRDLGIRAMDIFPNTEVLTKPPLCCERPEGG